MARALPILALLAAALLAASMFESDGPPALDASSDAAGADLDDERATLAGQGDLRAIAPEGLTGRARLFGVVRRGAAPVSGTEVGLARFGPHLGGLVGEMGWFSGVPTIHVPQAQWTARTDDRGAYGFSALAPGQYVVVAGDASAQRVLVVGIPADGSQVELDVDLPNGPSGLRGRARYHDGRPYRGRITAVPVDPGRWAARLGPRLGDVSTMSTADGSFRLRGLMPGLVHLGASLPTRNTPVGPVAVPFEGVFELVVNDAGFAFRGTVRNSVTGAPIHAAQVRIGSDPGPFADTKTAADGHFRFDLPGAPETVRIAAPGYATAKPTLQFMPDEAQSEIHVRLSPAGRIEGRVVGPGGGVLAGVAVHAYPDGVYDGATRTTTDANGTYSFGGLSSGLYTVAAFGGGWISKGLPEATIDGYNPFALIVEPGTTVRADLAVVAAPPVRGRVQDADGRAVSGATVWCFEGQSSRFGGWAESHWLDHKPPTVSAADGTFTFHCVVPGTDFQLGAAAPGQLPVETGNLKLTADGVVEGLESPVPAGALVPLRMPPHAFVDVEVLDATDGAPVSGAVVDLGGELDIFFWVGDDGPQPRIEHERRRVLIGSTDDDGRVRIGPVAPKGHDTVVKAPGYVSTTRLVIAAEPVRVELVRASGVSGRLDLPPDVERVVTSQTILYVGAHSTPIDWNGPGADLARVVEHLKDGDGTEMPVAPYRALVDEGGGVHVEHAESGERYTLFVAVGTGDRSFVGHAIVGSGDDGFRVALIETTPPKREVEDEATVTHQHLVLDVDPTVDVRDAVAWAVPIGNDGTPLDIAPSARGAKNGRFEFIGNADVRELLWYVLPGGRRPISGPQAAPTIAGPFKVSEAEVRVRPEPAREVSGRVLAGDGSAVRGARVVANPVLDERLGLPVRLETESHARAYTGPDGRFRLIGLGPFPYRLTLSLPPGFARVPATEVGERQSHVEIAVQRAVDVTVVVVRPGGDPTGTGHVQVGWIVDDDFQQLAMAEVDAEGRATLTGLDPTASYQLSGHIHGNGGHWMLARERWTTSETRIEAQPVRLSWLVVRNADGQSVEIQGSYRYPGTSASWFHTRPWKVEGSTRHATQLHIPRDTPLHVRIDHGGRVTWTTAVREGDDLVVELPAN